jgi:hypothetical protein
MTVVSYQFNNGRETFDQNSKLKLPKISLYRVSLVSQSDINYGEKEIQVKKCRPI